jgi:hypothetical protein
MEYWTREYRHGRTLEGSALATLTLTEEKDFDGLLLPLSLRSALSISSMSSLIFFACSSAWSRFSRSAADSFGGGRRAALIGSESERLLFVELIWEMNVAEGLESIGRGRKDRNAGGSEGGE